MANYTISETFTLPSKGLIYDKPINPEITLRSMTTMEEMKRLSPTKTPFTSMSEVIEECIVGKPEMKVCDMFIGDYQFLLHKLRIVTYGPEYKVISVCPYCGEVKEEIFDLETLDINEYEEGFKDLLFLHLPQCDKDVKLKLQTPRLLDSIQRKKEDLMAKNKEMPDPSLILTVESLIDTVDGRQLNNVELENFVQNLPMKDTNTIILRAEEINKKVGIDTTVIKTCENCGRTNLSTFRITSEFFGPTNN